MIITIPEDMCSIVMNSIAKSAKGFDNCIDANGYGNLSADEKTVLEWKDASEKLWSIVRQFSEQPVKDHTLKIVSLKNG